MTSRTHTLALLAAVAMTLALACDRDGGGSKTPESAVATPDSGRLGSFGRAKDGNLLFVFDQRSMADSTMAALAVTKARSAAVKEFARTLVGDNHALHERSGKVAAAAGLVPAPQPNDMSVQADRERLSVLQSKPAGASWDTDYLREVLTKQGEFLEVLRNMSSIAVHPELQALVKDTDASTRKQYQRTEELLRSLTK